MTETLAKKNPSILRQVPELMGDKARLDPYPWFERMRKTSPVRFDENRQCWDLFSYEAVFRAISDYDAFSSQRGAIGAFSDGLVNLDAPRHTKLRGLINKAFTAQASAALGPRIKQITHRLLDEVVAKGEMDVIRDLAVPLPVTVISELLGVPASDQPLIKSLSEVAVRGAHDSSENAAAELRQAQEKSYAELTEYFRRAAEERSRKPGQDLISLLLAAEVDGERLTERELIGFCILLLIAGNETTTNWLGNSGRCFLEFPELQERLRNKPELMASATQEVLRYRSAVFGVSRISAKNQDLNGCKLEVGDWVICWIASANRDEAKFVDADKFVADRAPVMHLSFGQGSHFCVGAPLARLEVQIAMTALLERTRNLRAIDERPMEALHHSIMYGLRSLPVRFDPQS